MAEPTRIMLGVNQSAIRTPDYDGPQLSISCYAAMNWAFGKIIRNNVRSFRVILIAIQPITGDRIGDLADIVRVRALLTRIEERCTELGVPTMTLPVQRGHPGEWICREAKRLRPDFVVLGSRGLNFFQQAESPSVSEYVTEHADCPVVSITRNPQHVPRNPIDD